MRTHSSAVWQGCTQKPVKAAVGPASLIHWMTNVHIRFLEILRFKCHLLYDNLWSNKVFLLLQFTCVVFLFLKVTLSLLGQLNIIKIVKV